MELHMVEKPGRNSQRGDLLDHVFQLSTDLFIHMQQDGTILDYKGQIHKSFPTAPNEIIGQKYIAVFPPELIPPFTEELNRIQKEQEAGLFEFSLKDCAYESRQILLPGTDEFAVIIRNITERKQLEKIQQKNEERYKIISSMTSDYSYHTIVKPDGSLDLDWVAGAFETITGFDFEGYVASGGWRAHLHPDDVQKDRGDIKRLQQGQTIISDVRTFAADGRIVWVRSYAQPEWDGKRKRLIGIFGAVQDITAQKEAELALRLSESRYRMLYRQNPAPMLVYERPSMRIIDVNDAFVDHYGYTQEEACSFELKDLYPPEEQERITELARVLKGYQNVGEWHHLKKDGTVMTIIACSHDLELDGKSARVAVMTDVSERKKAEDRIKRINIELEQRVLDRTAQLKASNEELESFSYSVSHDLRTPLRGMSGYAHFLREDYGDILPDQGKEYLNQIESSARRMDNLITGLLKMSRLSRQACERHEVHPHMVVEDAWINLKNDLGARQIQFVVDDLPVCMADPLLLKQVYINLLSNAIKFTRTREEARIQVGYNHEEDRIVYWVKDNGIGFDMHYAQNLFEPFLRAPEHEEVEGYGIGLSIVKRIILKHGGEIWAESQPDRGATFFFTIPPE
jgi:PAS domain S-box-containing protein